MSEPGFSEGPPNNEALAKYFEPVVVETSRVVMSPGSDKRVVTGTNHFLGYRLKEGAEFSKDVLELMLQNGINPTTLYVENTDGAITHIPLKEDAQLTRRDTDGKEHDMGKLRMASLRIQQGGYGVLSTPEPNPTDDKVDPQRVFLRITGQVKQAVFRTNFRLPNLDGKNSQLPISDISSRYHASPGAINIAAIK